MNFEREGRAGGRVRGREREKEREGWGGGRVDLAIVIVRWLKSYITINIAPLLSFETQKVAGTRCNARTNNTCTRAASVKESNNHYSPSSLAVMCGKFHSAARTGLLFGGRKSKTK